MQQRGDACLVHIQVAPGTATTVVEELAGLEDVAAVALVAGEYDVIAEIPYRWEQRRGSSSSGCSAAGRWSTKPLVAVRTWSRGRGSRPVLGLELNGPADP